MKQYFIYFDIKFEIQAKLFEINKKNLHLCDELQSK